MKRTFLITIMLMLCTAWSHAQQSFFEKYADMEGVSSVYISKTMLSMMPDMQVNEANIGKVASKLDNIQILSCEKKGIADKLRKETAYINTRNGYEELMRVKDENEKITIYLKKNKNGKKEFVLMCDETNELTIILITGDLTLQEIQSIVKSD